MKQQDIHNLIERFLDAETTLQEEQQLMEYFRQDDIPEELMQYREMFQDYEALATSYSPSVEEPVCPPATTITTVELSRRKHPPRLMLWVAAASIAALVVIGAGLLYINKVEEIPQIAQVEQEPADEQEEVIAPTPQSVQHDHHEAKRAVVPQVSKHAKHNNTKTYHQQPSFDEPYEFVDTYSDPEMARAEAERALQLLADNLNKGIEVLENATNT